MLGSTSAGILPAPVSGPARHAGAAHQHAGPCWLHVGAIPEDVMPLATGDPRDDERNRRAVIPQPPPLRLTWVAHAVHACSSRLHALAAHLLQEEEGLGLGLESRLELE